MTNFYNGWSVSLKKCILEGVYPILECIFLLINNKMMLIFWLLHMLQPSSEYAQQNKLAAG